ncbi:MAG: TolC family protein [Mariniblastus sp.]
MCSRIINLTLCLSIAAMLASLVGCQTNKKLATFSSAADNTPTLDASYLRPTEPELCPEDCITVSATTSLSPDAMLDYQNIQYTPITLSDCINRALRDSEVFRDLGGTIVGQPTGIGSSMDPALRYTDPNAGEEAALSAFDANLIAGAFFENNDRPFNNRFSGNTDGILVQDRGDYSLEFNKLAATGTLFTSRSTINYDNNNQAGNRFEGSTWEAIIDTGFRHPLLQGSGSLFNRIAGPSQVPGSYNGVLIARTNTEISLADFEEQTREFVANVENAYWDLYFAYRELNAQTDARDAAFKVFKQTAAKSDSQRISDLEKASAEEQYLRFESAIIESLEGRPVEGTQANSGSSGGSFRRTAGVRVAERRLRYLIGMSITDGTLLQPAEQPAKAPFVFDWNQSMSNALARRPEQRRQRWVVKQKELELTAARNFLLPRFDLVGNYRFRGLGKSLTGGGESLRDDIISGATAADAESGAFSDLASGDYQEVQFGAELRMPVGFRRANAGVRNAELSVQRERTLLAEQERKIVLDLSNAIAESRRAHSAMQLAEQRFNAAVKYRDLAAARIESGRAQMDVLLEAQRRILEAQLQFINAEVEYSIAIKNVHYEKGTFLHYHGVVLSESQSDPKAYLDHERRLADRGEMMSYVVRDASISKSPLGDATVSDATLSESIPATGMVGSDMGLTVPTDGMPVGMNSSGVITDPRMISDPTSGYIGPDATTNPRGILNSFEGQIINEAPPIQSGMPTGDWVPSPATPVAPVESVVPIVPADGASNGLRTPGWNASGLQPTGSSRTSRIPRKSLGANEIKPDNKVSGFAKAIAQMTGDKPTAVEASLKTQPLQRTLQPTTQQPSARRVDLTQKANEGQIKLTDTPSPINLSDSGSQINLNDTSAISSIKFTDTSRRANQLQPMAPVGTKETATSTKFRSLPAAQPDPAVIDSAPAQYQGPLSGAVNLGEKIGDGRSALQPILR